MRRRMSGPHVAVAVRMAERRRLVALVGGRDQFMEDAVDRGGQEAADGRRVQRHQQAVAKPFQSNSVAFLAKESSSNIAKKEG